MSSFQVCMPVWQWGSSIIFYLPIILVVADFRSIPSNKVAKFAFQLSKKVGDIPPNGLFCADRTPRRFLYALPYMTVNFTFVFFFTKEFFSVFRNPSILSTKHWHIISCHWKCQIELTLCKITCIDGIYLFANAIIVNGCVVSYSVCMAISILSIMYQRLSPLSRIKSVIIRFFY